MQLLPLYCLKFPCINNEIRYDWHSSMAMDMQDPHCISSEFPPQKPKVKVIVSMSEKNHIVSLTHAAQKKLTSTKQSNSQTLNINIQFHKICKQSKNISSLFILTATTPSSSHLLHWFNMLYCPLRRSIAMHRHTAAQGPTLKPTLKLYDSHMCRGLPLHQKVWSVVATVRRWGPFLQR